MEPRNHVRKRIANEVDNPLLRVPVFARCDSSGVLVFAVYRTALVVEVVGGDYLGEALDGSAVGLTEDVFGGEGELDVVPEGGG